MSAINANANAINATSAISAPIVQWATRNGSPKAAHTETGAVFAPKAARLGAALGADLTRMVSGRYDGFLLDVRAALTGRALGFVKSAMRSALVDAQRVAREAGDVNTENRALRALIAENPLMGVDGVTARALVGALATLASGTATVPVKGVDVAVKCSPRLSALAALGLAWLDAIDTPAPAPAPAPAPEPAPTP